MCSFLILLNHFRENGKALYLPLALSVLAYAAHIAKQAQGFQRKTDAPQNGASSYLLSKLGWG